MPTRMYVIFAPHLFQTPCMGLMTHSYTHSYTLIHRDGLVEQQLAYACRSLWFAEVYGSLAGLEGIHAIMFVVSQIGAGKKGNCPSLVHQTLFLEFFPYMRVVWRSHDPLPKHRTGLVSAIYLDLYYHNKISAGQ